MTSQMIDVLYRSPDTPLSKRMNNMQLSHIKKLREIGLPDHPYNWAGFIAFGDWR
jgi:hypothetical protein